MRNQKHSSLISYPHTLRERLYSLFFMPLLVILVIFVGINFLDLSGNHSQISFGTLGLAGLATTCRLLVAYFFAVAVAVPLAIFATKSPLLERIFLPVFDILESIPILAFFPILIILFIKFNFINGAAVFILFLSMLWNIVFTLIGGIKIIPKDILYAAFTFNIRGWKYIRQVILPAIFPELVTGSILAFAQGWNLIIVAEVMHVYIPAGSASQDLFGLGSILVQSATSGQNYLFLCTLVVMILIIALFNFFIWQKLLHYAQKYKFE